MIRMLIVSGFFACLWAGTSHAQGVKPEPFAPNSEACGMAAQSYAVVRGPDRRSERGRISTFPMSRCADLPRRPTAIGSISIHPDALQQDAPDPRFRRSR